MRISKTLLGVVSILAILASYAMGTVDGTVAVLGSLMVASAAGTPVSQCLGNRHMSFDVQMTNFAHGIAPDFSSSLAEIMAPQCVAPAGSGHYIAFDDDEAFRYVETKRALGGKMAMIDMPTNSPKFDCDPHAIGIPTDVAEHEKVGESGVPMLRESKVKTLVSRQALSREYRVFKLYEDGTDAEGGLGVWTNKDKDPIAEINSIVVTLMIQTGQSQIHVVIGLKALEQLGKHPKVLARFPGAEVVTVTAEMLKKLIMVPVVVHVAALPIALEKTGKAANKFVIGGDKVYALVTQKNPSPYDPSAAKTFTTRLGQVQGVGFYEEKPFAEINYMAWSEDLKMTGDQCVKRIDVTLGDIAP